MKIPEEEKRTLAQLREHYEIEKTLANKLRHANKEDRKKLYTSLYDELFIRVPHHHQVTKKNDDIERNESVIIQMKLLKHFVKPHLNFLEVGAGSCHLSLEMAKYVKKVYAIDVSEEITKEIRAAENFEFFISDGCSIPIPENSIDIAYSYQLIEHLHPDDAYEQLRNIYKAISPNGIYICVTTNKISGPHDISKYFDSIATGFHLKEYTATDLYELFQSCGFSEVNFYLNIKDKCLKFPFLLIKLCEKFIGLFPSFLRKNIINIKPFKKLLDVITIVGLKNGQQMFNKNRDSHAWNQ